MEEKDLNNSISIFKDDCNSKTLKIIIEHFIKNRQTVSIVYIITFINMQLTFYRDRRGRDRMVVGFTTTCVSCEHELRS